MLDTHIPFTLTKKHSILQREPHIWGVWKALSPEISYPGRSTCLAHLDVATFMSSSHCGMPWKFFHMSRSLSTGLTVVPFASPLSLYWTCLENLKVSLNPCPMDSHPLCCSLCLCVSHLAFQKDNYNVHKSAHHLKHSILILCGLSVEVRLRVSANKVYLCQKKKGTNPRIVL